jgi:glycerol-3-phosphate dehydrogenase
LFAFDVDIAIIGGGIGGLWLLNRLRARGYNAVLFEHEALGSQQSVNSQGMIHGGIKYALSGALTGSSEAIADMPEHWRRCLHGDGDVDLRGVNILSDHFYLWSTDTIASRLTSFFASKLTRGRVDNVAAAERHPIFQDPAFRGNVYRLVDMVLDVPSVLAKLAANARGCIYHIDGDSIAFERGVREEVTAVIANCGADSLRCNAQMFVFSAGAGNAELLAKIGSKKPEMQRRPLHQVLVKHTYPYPLYAHCTGVNPSPRLTISSHCLRDGSWVWYLGGDLATEGVALSEAQLIDTAKRELRELFPWVDFGPSSYFGDAQWATLRIDRAEPKQKGLVKPDKAFASRAEKYANVIVAWPTKLTLAPNMAHEVEALLNIDAKAPPLPAACADLPAPRIAKPCWELLF